MANSNILLQVSFTFFAAFLSVYYSGKGHLINRFVSEIIHGKSGCCPVPDVGNVTLHYFTLRERAEAIRFLLEDSQIPYKEINFNDESWPAQKAWGLESGLYTFGQVPAISTSTGVNLVQSHVILRYLGRSVGLDCDCDELHVCDTLAAGVEDFHAALSRLIWDEDFSLEQRDAYMNKTMPMWLSYFEKLAPSLANLETAFFLGDRLTWVDFLVFYVLENNVEFCQHSFGNNKVLVVDALEKFPKLAHFYRLMSKRPRLSKYIRSKRRIPFTVPYIPKQLRAVNA
ncbi:hypothetical protein CAPTEDRAFT_221061 [Capitella teleta]|uniref:Glutathione transferase n=1 Tax=Capitella teleta TaxID=283909 RepID=R7T6Q0_CAPTE|nr:hypothetical protein CAPTEDRAFT_221061 [Capitella teleta]|eukprot:ELT87050.1 hypothetical protein CAPTEDRAFT_221061 [Capitella teleta]